MKSTDSPAVEAPFEPTVMQRRCCAKTWPLGSMHGSTCGRTAKYEHNGKPYCKTHHPPAAKAKRDAKNAAWDAKLAQKQADYDAAAAEKNALRKNAERWAFLESNWNASIDGEPLHAWVAGNCLRLGGVAAAVDTAMAAVPAVGAA